MFLASMASWRNRLALAAMILCVVTAPALGYRIIFAPWNVPTGPGAGPSVQGIGDVDGNGIADFVIGDNYYSEGGFRTGRAYLYLPTTAGTFPDPVVLTYAESPGLFGKVIAPAGDVNNDGFADFLITSENIRAVHLFLGDGDPSAIERVVIPSPADERSTEVAGVGDVNGDGFDDFAVAALWDDVVWIYFGGESIDATPDLTLDGFGTFGRSVAPLGDMNGDGFADLAVGAPSYPLDGVIVGAVFFYLGGIVPDATPDFAFYGWQLWENFGTRMVLGGDLDGNGLRDLLVAAPNYDDAVDHSGRLDIFYLDATVGAIRRTSIYGEHTHEIWSIDGNADIDVDGVPDVVMAPFAGGEGPLSFFSGATLRTRTSVLTSEADWNSTQSVTELTSIGDVNGDGYRDLLASNLWDTTRGYGGRVMLLAGGHRIFPRFRLESSTVEAGMEAEVTVHASLETTDPGATVDVSALDLQLAYDDALLTFLGADTAIPGSSWLHDAAASGGTIRLSMASSPTYELGAEERPLFVLRFQTAATLGEAVFALQAMEAHASTDLPLWPLFETGTLGLSDASRTNPPAITASVRAYPNPFNPATTIEWVSPQAGSVTLVIYDVRGRRIWRESIVASAAGRRTARWPGVDDRGQAAASGSYLLEVRGADWSARTRLTLVR